MLKHITLFITSILVLGISMSASANMDSGLYDPLPPEGSAFVRFLNVAGEKGSEQSGANGKAYMYLKHREISPYFVIEEGKADVTFGEAKHSFDVVAGKFYTVILKKQLSVIEDESNDNRAKAQIILYNVSEEDNIALKTKDGKVAIVDNVEKGKTKSRQINPVKVELAVYAGDKLLKTAEPLSMERGMAYSGIFTGPNEELLWVRSTTNTRK